MTQSQVKRQGGFTLIELMVVVAIIAILSTIGIGGFASAQKKARDARRRADVKTIQSTMVSASDINGIPDMYDAMLEIGGKFPEDPSLFPYLVYAPLAPKNDTTKMNAIANANKFTKDGTPSIVFVENITNNVGLVCATLETADTGNAADLKITTPAGQATPPSGTKSNSFAQTILGKATPLTYNEISPVVGLQGNADQFNIKPCAKGANPGENCNLFCATF